MQDAIGAYEEQVTKNDNYRKEGSEHETESNDQLQIDGISESPSKTNLAGVHPSRFRESVRIGYESIV